VPRYTCVIHSGPLRNVRIKFRPELKLIESWIWYLAVGSAEPGWFKGGVGDQPSPAPRYRKKPSSEGSGGGGSCGRKTMLPDGEEYSERLSGVIGTSTRLEKADRSSAGPAYFPLISFPSQNIVITTWTTIHNTRCSNKKKHPFSFCHNSVK